VLGLRDEMTHILVERSTIEAGVKVGGGGEVDNRGGIV
jgi:hypothetical protein